ncbi:MAG: AbrB family transcriptional regulator [Pseudomonadota bacterium]
MIPRLTTFLLAGVGVAIFMVLDLPLPWLLGPIFACLLAALAGVQLQGIKPISDAMRTILGVAVGATFTPVLLASMLGMWPTLLLILAAVAATHAPEYVCASACLWFLLAPEETGYGLQYWLLSPEGSLSGGFSLR